MDIAQALSDCRIFMFGQQNLHNAILAGYINRRVNVDCQLVGINHWQEEWNRSERRTLVMIDTESARVDSLQSFISLLHDQPQDILIAFFNVIQDHPVEKLIVWPSVAGFFYQGASQQHLNRGITEIFSGGYWLPRHLMVDYLKKTRKQPKHQSHQQDILLTRREKEILRLTVTGVTNTEIARELRVSVHTVKTHIYNLYKKLGVSNRIQAVNWAKEHMQEVQLKESR